MTPHKTLWVFTPSRTDPKDLEYIHVQREDLLQHAVERVRDSALSGSKHHQLFVGPRGSGKTHLVTLIVHRVGQDAELQDRLRIAWLNEDETCTTLLEFLLKVHATLVKRYPTEYIEESLAPIYDLSQEKALGHVQQHLLTRLEHRTLLVVVENLDAIFEGLGDAGQKKLRAYLQEHPRFSLIASAQKLVDDLAQRTSPFFGFFQTEHLKPLHEAEATELLRRIAELQDAQEVAHFLTTSRGRSRVRALHHLSGGNHRIYLVLSQFITKDGMDDLVVPFQKMMDELTPYYQERLRWLPPLQRKIVEYLCTCETTVPVKLIARRLFATQQTISSQLQELREKGYLESNQRGREALYEISEPLMRICVEIKDNQNYAPLRLLVDFLRIWYEDSDLDRRLRAEDATELSRSYLQCALERNQTQGNLRKRWLLEDLRRVMPTSLEWWHWRYTKDACVNLPESFSLAVEHLWKGEKEEALRLFEEALHADDSIAHRADVLISRGRILRDVGDWIAAHEDFSNVIAMGSMISVELISRATLYRGYNYSLSGQTSRALEDYTAVISLSGVPVKRVTKALNYRGSALRKLGEYSRAIDDYSSVINLHGAPVDQLAWALNNRGITHGLMGDPAREIEDYSAVIALEGAPVEQLARALNNRGGAHEQMEQSAKAIEDYSAVTALEGASLDQVVAALFGRASTYVQVGEPTKAIEDYSEVIALKGAPVNQVAWAFWGRGFSCRQMGELARAIEDHSAVIGLEGASVEQVAMALNNRGLTCTEIGEPVKAIEDYSEVIALKGAPVDQVAWALCCRGLVHKQMGELAKAIEDYSAVISLEGAPVEQVARALNSRGITHGQTGDPAKEIADYTAVIALEGAPMEQVADALFSRALTHGQMGEPDKEIADYSAVIGLEGALVDQVAMALYNRAVTRLELKLHAESQADFESVLSMDGAESYQVVDASNCLAELHFGQGRWVEGMKALENSFEQVPSKDRTSHGDVHDIVGALFSAGMSVDGRQARVAELFALYQRHAALTGLGEGLVRHLGKVFQRGAPFPSTDNLAQWLDAWEAAAAEVEDFRLSLRLLRTGVEFLQKGGKDRGVLLTLTKAEREILIQAFALEERDK